VSPRRAISAFALFSYLAAVLLFPVLHRLHHLAHGADHVHTAAGTIYLGAHHDDDDDDDDDDHHDLAHYHAQHDLDLVALGLADVATAGVLTIDCAYAALTLATCDATAGANHPRTFGDDLLAHHHHDHDHEHEDANHGAGSLEHAQSHYACAAPILLPPPAERFVGLTVAHTYDAPSLRFRTTVDARGPPA
jgi:hypothetical protein